MGIFENKVLLLTKQNSAQQRTVREYRPKTNQTLERNPNKTTIKEKPLPKKLSGKNQIRNPRENLKP